MKKLIDEIRLVLCGLCFLLLSLLAPNNKEGYIILKAVDFWTMKTKLLIHVVK